MYITRICLPNGRFYSRSCNKPDFIDADEYFSDFFEFDENLTNYFNASSSLDSIKFSKCRVSQDAVINNAGNLLLDMCKTYNLFILNGRCGADINVGAMTFRGLFNRRKESLTVYRYV